MPTNKTADHFQFIGDFFKTLKLRTPPKATFYRAKEAKQRLNYFIRPNDKGRLS